MPAQFKITEAGLYLTRDGRTVEVTGPIAGHNYPWKGFNGSTFTDYGLTWVNATRKLPSDIIAKAPVPASKPRPAKGKKAKRRYRVRRQYWPQTSWMVCDSTVTDSDGDIAQGMTRADARMFAAMKEAQRGGA